eukprot:g2000.t1
MVEGELDFEQFDAFEEGDFDDISPSSRPDGNLQRHGGSSESRDCGDEHRSRRSGGSRKSRSKSKRKSRLGDKRGSRSGASHDSRNHRGGQCSASDASGREGHGSSYQRSIRDDEAVVDRARQQSNLVAQRRSRSVQVNAFSASVQEASIGGTKAVPFGQYHVHCELICTTSNSLDKKYTRWTVRRRYREFVELDRMLRARLGWRLDELRLPGKGVPAKIDDSFLEQRRTLLDAYLQQLQQTPGVASFSRGHLACEELSRFLDFERRGFAAANADSRSRANFFVLVFALTLVQLSLACYTVLVRRARPNALFKRQIGDEPSAVAQEFFETALVLCAAQAVGAVLVALAGAWCIDGCILPHAVHIPLFALLGFLGPFAGNLLFIAGIFLSTPVLAAMFLCNIPVWSVFAAHAFGIEAAVDAQALMRPAGHYTMACAAVSRVVGFVLTVIGSMIALLYVPSAQRLGTWLLLGSCICTVGSRAFALVVAFVLQLLPLILCLYRMFTYSIPCVTAADGAGLGSFRSHGFVFFNAQMTPHEGGGGACTILGLLMVCLATHRQETQTLTGYGPVEDDDDFGIQDHDLFNPHGQHEEL